MTRVKWSGLQPATETSVSASRRALKHPLQAKARSTTRGVTLIEMLIVVSIIGILAAVVGPTLFQKLDTSRHTATKA